jgi:hypothetical protein
MGKSNTVAGVTGSGASKSGNEQDAKPAKPAHPDDDEDEVKPPEQAVDVHLREAERILLDYLQLTGGSSRKGVAAAAGN